MYLSVLFIIQLQGIHDYGRLQSDMEISEATGAQYCTRGGSNEQSLVMKDVVI